MGEQCPFVKAHTGGSRRTETYPSATYTGATTAAESRSERRTYASVPATRSSCDQLTATLPLFGGEANTGLTAKPGSNAPCSATRVRSSRPSLSDRLTRSLITAGLVCGITPLSIRKLSGQPIRVLAFAEPDGGGAASQKRACSCSSGFDGEAA